MANCSAHRVRFHSLFSLNSRQSRRSWQKPNTYHDVHWKIMIYGSMRLRLSPLSHYKEKKLLENRFLFAWIPSDKIVAVCDYEVNKSGVHILQITTCKSTRGQGIGRNMIAALREQHQLPISALTDDNAVAFFCKCGFTVTPIKLLDGKWECWLR